MVTVEQLFELAWAGSSWPSCRLVAGHANRPNPELHDALTVIDEAGQIASVAQRVRDEHPLAGAHKPQWDLRLQDVLAEALGLAWTITTFGTGTMCREQGRPDIRVAERAWVEVKNVHLSDHYRSTVADGIAAGGLYVSEPRLLKRNATPSFVHKLESDLTDAVKKFVVADPLGTTQHWLWVRTGSFDFEATEEANWTAVEAWCSSRSPDMRVGIVIADRWRWRNPKYLFA